LPFEVQIVGELAASRKKARVFLAPDRLTDSELAHAFASCEMCGLPALIVMLLYKARPGPSRKRLYAPPPTPDSGQSCVRAN
jgi:hypothetical protein